jgi:hypothetical protein
LKNVEREKMDWQSKPLVKEIEMKNSHLFLKSEPYTHLANPSGEEQRKITNEYQKFHNA